MIRRCIACLVIAASAALTAAPLAHASPRAWLELSGGYSTYIMEDLNQEIRSVSDAISPLELHEIRAGGEFRSLVALRVSPDWSAGFGYEHLGGSSEAGDATGSIEYEVPGNAYFGFAAYQPPSPGKLALGIALGAGLVAGSGAVTTAIPGSGSVREAITGSGLFLEVMATGMLAVNPRGGICGSIGFRRARIAETHFDSEVVQNFYGTNYSLDYTGLSACLGLRIFIPGHEPAGP